MEALAGIVFFAVAVKAIVEYISTWVVNNKLEWKQIASFLFGEVIAFSFGLDAFKLVGIEAQVPFVSVILTGLIISGGANLVYDIFSPKAKTISVVQVEDTISERLENEKG